MNKLLLWFSPWLAFGLLAAAVIISGPSKDANYGNALYGVPNGLPLGVVLVIFAYVVAASATLAAPFLFKVAPVDVFNPLFIWGLSLAIIAGFCIVGVKTGAINALALELCAFTILISTLWTAAYFAGESKHFRIILFVGGITAIALNLAWFPISENLRAAIYKANVSANRTPVFEIKFGKTYAELTASATPMISERMNQAGNSGLRSAMIDFPFRVRLLSAGTSPIDLPLEFKFGNSSYVIFTMEEDHTHIRALSFTIRNESLDIPSVAKILKDAGWTLAYENAGPEEEANDSSVHTTYHKWVKGLDSVMIESFYQRDENTKKWNSPMTTASFGAEAAFLH